MFPSLPHPGVFCQAFFQENEISLNSSCNFKNHAYNEPINSRGVICFNRYLEVISNF